MLHIRALTGTDSLEDLTELLHRAYARLGAMGLNYTSVDQPVETTARRIAGGRCFVAELEGQVVGTAVVRPPYDENECEVFTRPGVASVQQFGVDPPAQGRGVGRALLDACEQWARERGFVELALDTAEQAEHLVSLYTRLGFRPVGHVQWTGKVYRSVVLSKAL